MPVVRGSIEVPAGAPDFAAVVAIRVEDVTRADTDALVVGEQLLHDVSLRGLRFEVPVEHVHPGNRYTVRVHVDVTGSGVLGVGDLLTMRSVPVLTHGAPDEVIVPVSVLD